VLTAWIQTNYATICDIAKVITKGREPDCDDLAHEVILAMLEADREKMNSIAESGGLRYWTVRLCLNNYRSSTSRYHYKYRKPSERHRKAAEHIKFVAHDSQEYKYEHEVLLDFVDDCLRQLPWFEANAFAIYFMEEHSLSTLSVATGINRNTLYKAIRQTSDYIRHEHKKQRTR
tara:strand:+ start:1191 stop:1715 length:525 start_codon:yes stop_codon:yes gene_type:complete